MERTERRWRAVHLLLVLGLNSTSIVWGQESLLRHLMVETGLVAATADSLPLWLHANRLGMIDPGGTNGYVRVHAIASKHLGGTWQWEASVQLVGRRSPHQTVFFPELYTEVASTWIRFWIGRRVYEIGETAGKLSMGSLGTGLNATPLPKVVLETPGFLTVPWTRGLLGVRAYLAHGWFDDPRHTRGAYLHQKFLYGRLQLGKWRFYGGLVHDVQWGGTSPVYGPQPDGIDDWWRVFWGMGGAPDTPLPEQVYYQGNHLGIWDVGVKGQVGAINLHIYRHFLFNDKDGLKLKNPGDGLLGIALTFEKGTISQVVYEYLYSKRQSGPIPPGPTVGRGGPGGQDNYYNHYIYRSGWTYYGRTISNPLFFPYPNGQIVNADRIANNRIVAHHVGLSGALPGIGHYVFKVTYSRNYGTYRARDAARQEGVPYFYENGPRQWSWYIALSRMLSEQLTLRMAVARDQGRVYPRSTGVEVTLRWQGR
ncbi:capsule assembly Wzi family protein [Rhodothermus profundi]|uniref:Capsule assembly protein Wzi n=1 Tax=Rhodothermus profundi TaxID=633813 RepID=A0A1M6PJG6_9BACT|nr:capsule assembly Wzi family protein [Rhodothermus profundi]SHK08086.1 Capsule assembly protein Wzi [Rhodothermus profundi]